MYNSWAERVGTFHTAGGLHVGYAEGLQDGPAGQCGPARPQVGLCLGLQWESERWCGERPSGTQAWTGGLWACELVRGLFTYMPTESLRGWSFCAERAMGRFFPEAGCKIRGALSSGPVTGAEGLHMASHPDSPCHSWK